MSILAKVTTGRRGRAQKVVIYAPEGFGKSTLASLFPKPLFLDVEESTDQLDAARLGRKDLPDLKTFESALGEIAMERPYQTVVVDTIDWLEEMAVTEICAEHKCGNIEEVGGGFGKGYNYLTNRVSVTLAKFDAVIAAGINVVLLAHSSIVRFDPPDGAGAFDRYELKLYKDRKGGKGTASLIKEWSDMLIFGNWRTQVTEKGKGNNVQYKGVGGRERLMYCNRTAAWDAKNRHGMGDVEKWDIAVIEKAFKSVNAPWGEASVTTDSRPEKVKAFNERQPALPAGVLPTNTTSPKAEVKKAEKPLERMTRDELVAEKTRLLKVIEDGGNDGGDIEDFGPVIEAIDALLGKMPSPVTPMRTGGDDELPGVDNPPTVDAEIARICEPHSAAITEYLRGRGKIKADQDWRSMPDDYAARVKKNPAGFLKQVGINGEAVAA